MTQERSEEGTTLPDLAGRRVVIAGGTGSVGEGIVATWLRAGADVIVPTRSVDKGRQLEAFVGADAAERLHLVEGDYTSIDGAARMSERITAEHGNVDDVVASLGSWWQRAPLWEITSQEWERWMIDPVTAHVATARAWIPRLPDASSYQVILGGSAVYPVAGASIVSLQGAAALMLRRVLAAEVGEKRRVVGIILAPVASRHRRWVDPSWITNTEVGQVSVGIAASPNLIDSELDLQDPDTRGEVFARVGLRPPSS